VTLLRAAALLAALALLAGGGCSRLPRIVVLNVPLSAEEHVALGVGYERQGKLSLAAREYERAIRKDSRCFQAHVNRGNVALAEGDPAGARKRYLEALALRPGDPEATNNLAAAAIRSGDPKRMAEARKRLDAALAVPAYRLPALLETRKELEEAIAGSSSPR
jgi:Tfp pilus assembly protein PilF